MAILKPVYNNSNIFITTSNLPNFEYVNLEPNPDMKIREDPE